MLHDRLARPGRIVSTAMGSRPARLRDSVDSALLDECLLELILIDTLVVADARREVLAEQLLRRRIPPAVYPRVMDRYDELSRDVLDDADVLALWLPRAAAKDNRWKAKMLRWFLYVVAPGHRTRMSDLIEVARLASAIGAARQCRRLYRRAYDFDPYDRPAPPGQSAQRRARAAQAADALAAAPEP